MNTSVQLLASEGECLQRGSRRGGGREDMSELPSAAFNASISIHLNIPAQGLLGWMMHACVMNLDSLWIQRWCICDVDLVCMTGTAAMHFV